MLAGEFQLNFHDSLRGKRSRTSRAKSDPAKEFFTFALRELWAVFLGQKKNIRIFVVGLTNRMRQLSHITGFPLGQILVTC